MGKFRMDSAFEWNQSRNSAALALAEGKTQKQAAEEAEVTDRTIRQWLQHPEFMAEVDRLSLMVGIAAKAERLRIAQRVVRQKTQNETVDTDKDLLEWLKFAQSETDGIKLDIAKVLAALGSNEEPLAG